MPTIGWFTMMKKQVHFLADTFQVPDFGIPLNFHQRSPCLSTMLAEFQQQPRPTLQNLITAIIVVFHATGRRYSLTHHRCKSSVTPWRSREAWEKFITPLTVE
jgi:hypothetical protein